MECWSQEGNLQRAMSKEKTWSKVAIIVLDPNRGVGMKW